jgi:type II secretory pathway pseudopilin PulG
MIHRLSAKARGFTLIETVMAMASVGAVGLSIFYTLYYGLLLFTKNTAMNVSHEEARLALLQLETDIHSAVSPPSLTDSNGVMISGTGASPGVEFQVLISSKAYCQITANAAAGQNIVMVGLPSGYPTPYVGMRLIIPSYEIEQNITAVSVSGTVATCTLAGNVSPAIDVTDAYGSYDVTCFLTQRVYYYVTGSTSQGASPTDLSLNYIGVSRNQTYNMASTDLSSATPFSIPSTSTGAANYHYVMVTGLSTQDPQTTHLSSIFGFNTSSLMLNGQIPEYSTLTTYQ